MSKNYIISFLIFLFAFLSPYFVFAQDRQLEVDYPEIAGIKPETVTTGLPEYVKYVFNFSVTFFGLVVFGALLWAGFLYLNSFGNPDKLKEAKDRIVSAFLGLIILFSSYIVFANINPQLVIFPFPPLTPAAKKEAPKLPAIKPEEINLIAIELPLGQSIENGLWQRERRAGIEVLIEENEAFLNQNIKVDDKELETIAGLNKYLKSLTEDCHCEELKGLCTEPESFSQPVGCSGDPCPKEIRKKIEKILGINQEKMKKLLEFREKILVKETDFEHQLTVFQNIEQEMLSCETQQKQLFDLNEHLSRLNYFRELGWKVQTLTIPGAPKSQGDPLTFYCSAGGNIFDYPYTLSRELPLELTVPELYVKETTAESMKISCPAGIPLGEVIDQFREMAILLITKLEKLRELHLQMISQIEQMGELVSQCNDTRCDVNCNCVPNPCYQRICGCIPVCPGKPPIPNPCYPWCNSPCLQAVGVCHGEPCPRQKIAEKVAEIKETEDEILKTVKEIKEIFPDVSYLLANSQNPKNLANLRQGMSLCYSPNVEEPTWALLDCATAVGNFGPSGQIIGQCHPRNFFCCTLSEEGIQFPWQTPTPETPALSIPYKKFTPLAEGEKGCPEGWICDDDVKNFNQYKDASQPLKEFISCMRESLDGIQKEEELKGTVGDISSISDSKLYPPQETCSWEGGPAKPGGCSHLYYIKYKLEVVSAHYGGPACRAEHKSYALDLGDEQNAEYIIKAAKACRPDVYVNFRTPGHYDHIHISIGQTEGCGAN